MLFLLESYRSNLADGDITNWFIKGYLIMKNDSNKHLSSRDLSAIKSSIESIKLLVTFAYLSVSSKPSKVMLERAFAHINDTCCEVDEILSKFDA